MFNDKKSIDHVIVAQAGLIARGFILQTDSGIKLTEQGRLHARECLDALPREYVLLLVAYIKETIWKGN